MEKNSSIVSAAQQIDSGVVGLELASDLFQILCESFEDEFAAVHPESALENLHLKKLSLYSSAATVFQTSMIDALSELKTGRDCLYTAIRKGDAAQG